MQKAIILTAALEDYLEAIFNLCRGDKAARSRDIAEALKVHKSTVTAALKSLGNMRLIHYSPYEAVTLTSEGRRFAADVVKRHAALRDFFIRVLKVDEALAETAACGMEHAMPREIVEKLAKFAESVSAPPVGAVGPREAAGLALEQVAEGAKTLTLAAVLPGRMAKVVAVRGGAPIKRRLSEMGLVRGIGVVVERVAPLGDPLEIKVRGYRLSIRRDDAARIVVEEVEEYS